MLGVLHSTFIQNKMSYSYREVTEIINSQKPFIESKYGISKIGIFNYSGENKGVRQVDFLIHTEKPIGMYFIDFAEFIESVLNVDAEILTEDGLENIKDEALRNGIKKKVVYV